MSEPKQTPKERAAEFMGRLRKVCNDRGKLAALRRGLVDNPRLQVDAWPVIAGLGGDIGNPTYMAVSALYASHPNESEARNFGETCRRIAKGDGNDIVDSMEKRFRRLLACGEQEEVIQQLRSWIRMAASKGVNVNYESLFADLWNWPWYAENIRIKWAKSFWHSGDARTPETSNQESPA
jgi:CRISPR type I-E-associated protein CasB/Cse2